MRTEAVSTAIATFAVVELIVGWQIADHLRTDLVLDALEMAIWRRVLTDAALRHHSDAGCRYTSFGYTDRLSATGIVASIGSILDSINAMAAALNRTFKAELVYLHGPWRTRVQFERAAIDWIDWYNSRRLNSASGYTHPSNTNPLVPSPHSHAATRNQPTRAA